VIPREPSGHAERNPGHVWRFADCELDERRRELEVRGTTVEVDAKPPSASFINCCFTPAKWSPKPS
jgi:hypothetical protein